MLNSHKDPGSIAAEILMMRMVHDDAFLVVEGVSDLRFWTPRRHRTCELVDGEGKSNVVGAIKNLDDENIRGVLGIVDDDYDSLMGNSYGTRNLVKTDVHDLECLLCRSSALDTVLAEFGIASKIRRFEEVAGVDVRRGLLERTLEFGRLRWLSKRDALHINFKDVPVRRFVDINTWTVDSDQLTRVASRIGSSQDYEELQRRIAQLPSADPWRVAHGHDMIQILRVGLMEVLGALPASKGTEDIARVLRAAMPSRELKRTTLWAEIRAWERSTSHLILPA